MAHIAAEEYLTLFFTVANRTEALCHTELHHHGPGQRCCFLDVIGRTGGRIVEDKLFSRPTAQHVRELIEHLASGCGVLLLVW